VRDGSGEGRRLAAGSETRILACEEQAQPWQKA